MITRFSFIKAWVARSLGVAAVGVGAVAFGQVVEPSGIFGFKRVVLNGSGESGGVSMVGPSFVEEAVARVVLVSGAPRPYELQATAVAWGAGEFSRHSEVSSHAVEVRSSSNLVAIGMTSEIVRHTSSVLTIRDDWSGILRGGETVVIRPHKTLAGVFGAANESGLASGDPTTSDVISILHEGTGASFASYYYRTGTSLGGTGWRLSANPFVDQGSLPLRAGHGLMVKRRGTVPMELVLQGFVKTGAMRRMLPAGYSLVDPLAPITDQRSVSPAAGVALTLGGVVGNGIVPSGLGGVLNAGTAQTADRVTLAGTMAGYYLALPSGLSAGGWRLTSNPFVDQQETVIPPASAMLIQNRGSHKWWVRPQPFYIQSPAALGTP